jgi:hypothetical protein
MRFFSIVALCVAPGLAAADTYSIVNPRPRADMREMATDRPDTTESPISVDAGHVQIEMDLVAVGIDRASVDSSTVDIGAANMKVGVTDRVDLQLVVEPYHRESVDSMTTSSGYGGTTARAKINLWGNDGGPTAGALLPFTSRSGGVWNVGLAVPVGFELPGGFGSAVMGQLEIGDVGGERAVAGMLTGTASHDVVGPVGAYVEAAITVAGASGDDVAVQADGGFTVAITGDVQADVGTRLGVVGDAPDAEIFLGLSARR